MLEGILKDYWEVLTNEEILTLVKKADRSFDKGYFEKAQKLYEEVFEVVLEKINKTYPTVRKIAKGIGWGTAILTGGIGVEDIFIIPAVSKGIDYLFGINPTQLTDVLKYISYQELLSAVNGELLNEKDEYYYLKKFALLYQDGDSKNPLKAVLDLYLPISSSSPIEENFANLTPIIRSKARNIKSIEVKVGDNILKLRLNNLLYKYASHFRWDFVAEVFAEGRKKRSRKINFSEDGMDVKEAYEVLGVSGKASPEEIKKAYHRKVSEWHPDKLGNMAEELRKYAEEQLKKINSAYQILVNKYGYEM